MVSCNKTKKIFFNDFVYLDEDVFKINDTVFFPLMLNYKVDMRLINNDVVVSPARYYENRDVYESNTKADINAQFSNHVELMKELGFNTIRLCIDVVARDDKGMYYPSSDGRISLTEDTKKILDGIAEALDIIRAHDMKAMLLLKPPFEQETEDFTIAMLKHFADNPTIFAYDFMNEPLYFDIDPHRKKEDARIIVTKWRDMVREYSPKHLFTIGFSEPIEVFEWDPSILPVDFIQIHTYHPLRIKSEIWWYNNYCGKPWIIGETSLPSDNDSISYDMQYHFVDDVIQYVIDCGGSGFGWWEFQDHINSNMNFEANYAGLMNNDGITITKSGNKVIGTLKPAAYEFAKWSKGKSRKAKLNNKDLRPANYFNMLGYENYVIKGKIINKDKAVEGALIRGWNQSWKVGLNTYSDENGEFTLYSNDSCVHFEISAPGMENIKFDRYDLKYENIDNHSYSDLNDIDLEYHKISVQPFLKNDTSLFDFKEELFDRKKFEADMGTIQINDIEECYPYPNNTDNLCKL